MTDDTPATFDITLLPASGGGYPVIARGPGGDATGIFRMPLDSVELQHRLANIHLIMAFDQRVPYKLAQQTTQDFGQMLFDSLFEGPIRELYSRTQATQLNNNIVLRLTTEANDLASLPWELLYDRQRGKYLALSHKSALLRFVPTPNISQTMLGTGLPLRMLVILANPLPQQPLDLDHELAQIEQATADLCATNQLEIATIRGANTLPVLQRMLRTQRWNFMHIVGPTWHGPGQHESGLIFENARGAPEHVKAADLALLLADQPLLRMVYLSLDDSQINTMVAGGSIAAALVRSGVPAALGWQRPPLGVPSAADFDVARVAFMRAFYETLAEGGPLDLAITEARKALAVQTSSPAWAAASLYTRLSDQRLFTIVSPAPSTTGRTRDDERQRRAAEAARDAQVEQDARRLEAVASVAEIAQAARGLGGGDLDSPASSVLRSFGRIGQDVGAALQQGSSYNQRTALTVIEDRLDVLYRELAASPLPYAGRFQPIADHWRAVIGEHVRALADEVEQLQEIDSPYIAGPPLTEQQDTFTGRTGASQRIEQLVLDRRSPPLLLYGQRRMGKTSLLRNLGRLLPSTIVPMFVDLQGPPANASDHAGLLYNLARAMADSAQRYRQIELLRLTREALATDPFTVFDEWLDDVERVLGRNATSGRTALLMLDEFEALEKPFGAGRFDETQVLGTLRNLIQHRPRFRVLLAGTHTFDEYARWASYLINVQLIHLSYLGEKETRELIERPMTDFALRYEPAAVDRIIALTRGHPYLAQLLCSEIVALKNQQEVAMRRLARLADVEQAVPQALDSGAMFFADLAANQVDAAGRALLTALAAAGEGQASPLAALAPALPDPADAAQVAERLRRRELIEPAGTGFRFQVELIRRWFARA